MGCRILPIIPPQNDSIPHRTGPLVGNLAGASVMHLAARTNCKGKSAPNGVRRLTLSLRLRTKRYSNRSEPARASLDPTRNKIITPNTSCTNSCRIIEDYFVPFPLTSAMRPGLEWAERSRWVQSKRLPVSATFLSTKVHPSTAARAVRVHRTFHPRGRIALDNF